jgi:hypothetical protein
MCSDFWKTTDFVSSPERPSFLLPMMWEYDVWDYEGLMSLEGSSRRNYSSLIGWRGEILERNQGLAGNALIRDFRFGIGHDPVPGFASHFPIRRLVYLLVVSNESFQGVPGLNLIQV